MNSRKTLFRPEKGTREGHGLKHLSSDIFEDQSVEEVNFFVSPGSKFGVKITFF